MAQLAEEALAAGEHVAARGAEGGEAGAGGDPGDALAVEGIDRVGLAAAGFVAGGEA